MWRSRALMVEVTRALVSGKWRSHIEDLYQSSYNNIHPFA